MPIPENRITCGDIHFEDGTVKHMDSAELRDYFKRERFRPRYSYEIMDDAGNVVEVVNAEE